MNEVPKISIVHDTAPGTRLIDSIINKRWSVKQALAEMIDNSLGETFGQASVIYIGWNSKAKVLYVLDDGLGIEEIGEAFKLGSGSKDKYDAASSDIGRWGIGATEGGMWLAHEVAIYSLRNNMLVQSSVNWDDVIKANVWPKLNADRIKVSAANPAPAEFARNKVTHGTLIKMKVRSAAPHNRQIKPEKLIEELARMYGPGLRQGKRIIWQTIGGKVSDELLKDPIISPDKRPSSTPVILDGTQVTCGNVTLYISGRVYYSTETPQKEWGIDLCYGFRIIEREVTGWYNDPTGRKHQANHVSGRVKLEGRGWLDHISRTKQGMIDHELERALHRVVYEKIKGLLTASENRIYSLKLRGLEKALAASLARSMNKKSDFTDVDPDTYKQPPRTGTRPIKPPKDDVLPPVDPDAVKKPRAPSGKPPNAKRRAGNVASIRLDFQSSDQMRPKGSVANATADLDQIQAFINDEIPMMMDAREKNHPLLNYTIISEIAAAMAKSEDPAAFFQDPARRELLDGEDQDAVRLLITSFMINDVVDAPLEDPEDDKPPPFAPTFELIKKDPKP